MPKGRPKKIKAETNQAFTVVLDVSNQKFSYFGPTIFDCLKQIDKTTSFKTLPHITVLHNGKTTTRIVPIKNLRRLIQNDITKALYEKRFKLALGL